MTREKIRIGDVFSIETKKGLGFMQLVYLDNVSKELIRVYYALCENKPENISDVLLGEYFFINFPVKAAYNRGIIKKVDHVDLPTNFERPKYMRSESLFKDGWDIVEVDTLKRKYVGKLNKEEMLLSSFGVWNDTLLIDSLESGWRLSDLK